MSEDTIILFISSWWTNWVQGWQNFEIKSVNICQSYRQLSTSSFFYETRCIFREFSRKITRCLIHQQHSDTLRNPSTNCDLPSFMTAAHQDWLTVLNKMNDPHRRQRQWMINFMFGSIVLRFKQWLQYVTMYCVLASLCKESVHIEARRGINHIKTVITKSNSNCESVHYRI